MDEDLARILVAGGTIVSRELTRLYDLLRQRLPDDNELRFGVASALAEVGLKVIQPAFDAHPELQVEFERAVGKILDHLNDRYRAKAASVLPLPPMPSSPDGSYRSTTLASSRACPGVRMRVEP